MIELYLAMVALTGIHLVRLNRPREAAHWLALAGMSAFWPVLMVWVIFETIRRGVGRDGGG